MRYLIVQILFLSIMAYPARSAEVLYVAHAAAEPEFEVDLEFCQPGPGGGYVGYVENERKCADALVNDLRGRPDLVSGYVSEVALMTSRPGLKTLYRVGDDRRVTLPLANIIRRTGKPLVIRGQRDAEGNHLVWLKGLDLIDTVCDPDRVIDAESCRGGRPWAGKEPAPSDFDRRYELTSLAAVENTRIGQAIATATSGVEGVTEKGPRAYCARLSNVSGIELLDIAFEDCWITAVQIVNARNVTLRGLRIHGSTFGALAIATSGMEAGAHTYRVLETHWVQSPGAYRPKSERNCAEPHLDLSCAIDVWNDLPWGVAHHHLWRPLNGALFAGYNIAGNVLIDGNTLERAYNGVRIISELPGTGRNVEIRNNRFRFLRDNAVEPEKRADGWVVKHNIFQNVHAWISSDGVDGGSMYVFGNVSWYDPDKMPGMRCSDDTDWASSPRFVGLAGDLGRYQLIDISYDPTSVKCRGHYRGAVLKTGDKRKAKFPYFDGISIFNNSWRTRSPLFSSKHAAPLSHFNNAIEFTGCGLDGPWHCKQIPVPAQYCGEGNKRTRGRVALEQYWTSDGGALVADCFSFTPGPAVPDDRARETRDVSHTFCRDIVNRAFEGVPYQDGGCELVVIENVFRSRERGNLLLKTDIQGCTPRIGNGLVEADCNRPGPLVGAYLADGRLFDMDISGAGFLGSAFQP